MSHPILAGSTGNESEIRILDSNGDPKTDVTASTPGLALRYRRAGGSLVTITPTDLSNINSAHSAGGLIHKYAGYYRIDIADAAFVSGAAFAEVSGTLTNCTIIGSKHPIVASDPAVQVASQTTADAINNKTTNLPAQPAAVGSQMTLADDAITAAKLKADAVTKIQSGLALSTSLPPNFSLLVINGLGIVDANAKWVNDVPAELLTELTVGGYGPGMSPAEQVQSLKDLLEATKVLDTSQDPWELVFIKKGTGSLGDPDAVELLRQQLKTAEGENVTSIETSAGQTISV